MRLLPVSTAVLTTAALSLWAAATMAAAPYRVLADLRSAAVAATVLAGVAAVAWRGLAELARRDQRGDAEMELMRQRERALIRVIDHRLGGDHPSGPFSAIR